MTTTTKQILWAGAALAALAGCVDHKGSLHPGQINTLDVQLLSPAAGGLGSPSSPVDVKQATFNILARDDQGTVLDTDASVDVFISFGGIKTGQDTTCGADVDGLTPLQTIKLAHGMAMNQTVSLPSAYGSTAIWIDEPISGATGGSPTIYFRNALIPEVQTPSDPTASNATFCSSFNNKFITIDHASTGGQLVVTSVFGNAFSVTDTGTNAYNSIYLYAFGKPPSYIVEGRVLNSFSGNYSKFVGFTELNFPLFDANMDGALATVPAPIDVAVDAVSHADQMLPNAASVIRYTGKLCDPFPPNPTNDANVQKVIDSWNKYNQFVVGNDSLGTKACDAFYNIAVELPAKVLGSFDPLQHRNENITVVGMLQNHSGQNPYLDNNGNQTACLPDGTCQMGTCINGFCYKGAYNFWTMLPRRQEDITLSQ